MNDERNRPLPRLQHVKVGQYFTLVRDGKRRELLDKCNYYGYSDGFKAGLSSELVIDTVVWGKGGWRIEDDG